MSLRDSLSDAIPGHTAWCLMGHTADGDEDGEDRLLGDYWDRAAAERAIPQVLGRLLWGERLLLVPPPVANKRGVLISYPEDVTR
jgi:hypothetical protein